MHLHSERWYLDPEDQIRANRLVQGELDVAGFERWYTELQASQVTELAIELCFFATQAGLSAREFDAAVARLEPRADPGVEENLRGQLLSSLASDDRVLRAQIQNAPADARRRYFWLAVHLFAEAERKHGACGSDSACNHGWHRDLRDEQVVRDILVKVFGREPAPGLQRKPGLFRALLSRLRPGADA